MKDRIRATYEALPPEQRAQVDAMLAPEVARGWIPRDGDIEARDRRRVAAQWRVRRRLIRL